MRFQETWIIYVILLIVFRSFLSALSPQINIKCNMTYISSLPFLPFFFWGFCCSKGFHGMTCKDEVTDTRCAFFSTIQVPGFLSQGQCACPSYLPLRTLPVFLPRHHAAAAAVAKSLQSCPTLCNPIDGSPPGSPVPGILQARTLAISFSNAWKWKVKVKSLSRVRLCATAWTAAYQAPPSMGFSRQEYWSGVPLIISYSGQVS